MRICIVRNSRNEQACVYFSMLLPALGEDDESRLDGEVAQVDEVEASARRLGHVVHAQMISMSCVSKRDLRRHFVFFRNASFSVNLQCHHFVSVATTEVQLAHLFLYTP